MFKSLKQHIQFKKSVKEFKKKQDHLEMPSSDLQSLSDDDLIQTVLDSTLYKTEQYEDLLEGVGSMSHEEQVFYVAFTYDMEVNNGGLVQFFSNPSGDLAPMLPECLGEISANEHLELFESFVREHDIDLHDLSDYRVDDIGDFAALYERFPYDAFDEAFSLLPSIWDFLAPYIRAHLSAF